jgi:hypothetical protein
MAATIGTFITRRQVQAKQTELVRGMRDGRIPSNPRELRAVAENVREIDETLAEALLQVAFELEVQTTSVDLIKAMREGRCPTNPDELRIAAGIAREVDKRTAHALENLASSIVEGFDPTSTFEP